MSIAAQLEAVERWLLRCGCQSAAKIIHRAHEHLTQLETRMRTAEETVKALIADDTAKTAQIAQLQKDLAAAQALAITPETKAAADALVPEVPAPAPQ